MDPKTGSRVADVTYSVFVLPGGLNIPIYLNIGTGFETSTNRILEVIAEYCGHKQAAVHAAVRAGDIHRISLDSTRAKIELDWTPEVSLEDGLKTTVEWFRQQAD